MNIVNHKVFKSEVKKLKKDKCEHCGSQIDLQVHHKDMMSKSSPFYFDLDRNTEDNIVTLCRSCHMVEHSKSCTGQFNESATNVRRKVCLKRNIEENPMKRDDVRKRVSESLVGRVRYTNGVENITCKEGCQPEGFYPGLTRKNGSTWIKSRRRVFNNKTGKAAYLKEDEWHLIGTVYKERLADTEFKINKSNSEGSSTIEKK